ncbi:hypothetical protein [Anaerocolumna sp. MB42-C2]|uniref:hypothetical protein n=1 Tax=Anaerocolumna sp. MB42-C2 TaxID=3070997 RepID=UPI0027DFEC24|nr:hypothetical protein [Anaerocolumna sp. MB42-C2]WMJ85475.1 hypothetical protein RBU59_15500 [Anaerocolumna sp. MB42-C2]
MDIILSFILKVVASVGGAGAIIIALSTFIAKVWADLFMRKKTTEYDKQIEFYKKSLELEIERYKSLSEQITYKNKKIFDTEYNVLFQELAPKLEDVKQKSIEYLKCVQPDQDIILYKNAINALDDYNYNLLRRALFIDERIYDLLKEYYILCREYINSIKKIRENIFKMNLDKDMYNIYLLKDENHNEIVKKALNYLSEAQEVIIKGTREYVKSMASM